ERPGFRSQTRRHRELGAALIGAVLVAAAAVVVVVSRRGSSVRVAPNSVAVIDAHSNQVAAVVPVSGSPGPIAFGSRSLRVANVTEQTVSRVDPVSLRTVRTIPLGGATATDIAASRGTIWVVESDLGASSVLVRRIDPMFNALGPARQLANVTPGGSGALA